MRLRADRRLSSMNVVELTSRVRSCSGRRVSFRSISVSVAGVGRGVAADAVPCARGCGAIPSRSTRVSRLPHADLCASRRVCSGRCCHRGSSSKPSGATASSRWRWSQASRFGPPACRAALGQDFFLAGYRVFTTVPPAGRPARCAGCEFCAATRTARDGRRRQSAHALQLPSVPTTDRDEADDRSHASARTADGAGDLEVTADLSRRRFLPDRRFRRCARRGDSPARCRSRSTTSARHTAIIAIGARRTNWRPRPGHGRRDHIAFFDDPRFEGCTPILAAAFHVSGVDYRWERAVRYPLAPMRRRLTIMTAVSGRSFASTGRSTLSAVVLSIAVARDRAAAGAVRRRRRRSLCSRTGLAAVSFWIVASLAASWIVYDHSALMRWDWVADARSDSAGTLDQHPRGARRVVARAARDCSGMRAAGSSTCSIPVEMTEPSIADARRHCAPTQVEAERVDLPSTCRSRPAAIEAACCCSRRTSCAPTRRALALFSEIRRVLRPAGRVIVAEHLRDAANCAAFGPGVPALPFTPHVDALLRGRPVRHPLGIRDHAVRPRVRPEEAAMIIVPETLLLHLHVVGLVMALLVVINVIVPFRLRWRDEMARLSLLNRQIFQAHSVFLILTLGLFSALLLTCAPRHCSSRRGSPVPSWPG